MKLFFKRMHMNTFKPESIVLEEFRYARETAFQAMNDRHTLLNFFLVLTGLITSVEGPPKTSPPIMSVIWPFCFFQ